MGSIPPRAHEAGNQQIIPGAQALHAVFQQLDVPGHLIQRAIDNVQQRIVHVARELPADEFSQLGAMLALILGSNGPEVGVAGAREDGAHDDVIGAEAAGRFMQGRRVREHSLRVDLRPLVHARAREHHHKQLLRLHREVAAHGVLERLAVARGVQVLHDVDLGVGLAHETLCEDCFVGAEAGDGEVCEEDLALDGAEGDRFEGRAEVAGGFFLEGGDEVALGVGWVLLADRVDGGAVAVGEDGDERVLVGAEALAGFVDGIDVGRGDDGRGDGRGSVVDWRRRRLVLLGRAAEEGGRVLRLLRVVLWRLLWRVAGAVAGREVGGERRGVVAASLAAGELLLRVALGGKLLLRRVVLRRVLLVLLLRGILLGIGLLRGVYLLRGIAAAGLGGVLLRRGVTGGWVLGRVAARCGVAARGRALASVVAVRLVRHEAVSVGLRAMSVRSIGLVQAPWHDRRVAMGGRKQGSRPGYFLGTATSLNCLGGRREGAVYYLFHSVELRAVYSSYSVITVIIISQRMRLTALIYRQPARHRSWGHRPARYTPSRGSIIIPPSGILEADRDRDSQRQTEKQTQRHRGRQRQTQRQTETVRDSQRQSEKQTETQRESQKQTETNPDKQRLTAQAQYNTPY